MSRRVFRPTLWATVWAAAPLALMLGLAVWQLQRLEWNLAAIAREGRSILLPALTRDELLAVDDAAPFEFRRARLTGTFDHAREMHLVARSMNGNVGVQVVTPFALENGPTQGDRELYAAKLERLRGSTPVIRR